MTTNKDFADISFSKTKLLVVGDVMLDKYWHGSVSRISPEAPVPVVKINNTDNRLGGAANVAKNLVALGCNATLLGAIGNDDAGKMILELLKDQNVSHNLLMLKNFSTITKLRVLCKHQQMIRLDHEDELETLDLASLKAIHDLFASEISKFDTLVLSDYAKGVLYNPRPYIEVANAFKVPVIVDPKSNDFSLYSGATIVKPNLAEFEKIVGKSTTLEMMVDKARTLLSVHNIGCLVITRGGDGITVVPATGEATHLPALGGEVYDVTGAGDTVLAVLAAGLSSGLDIVQAAHLSTIAAGLVVSKVGTSSVSLQELKNALKQSDDLPLGVIPEERLREVIKQSQARGEKTVFVNGCYDFIHYGHIRYLERARALGDRLVVGVNTDASVKRLKGPDRPMYNEQQRMEVLASLKAVDWVVTFDENTPGRLVESLNPNIIAKGDEHFKSVDQIPAAEGVEHVLRNGGSVHLISRTPDCSSSKMIEFVSENQ
jgi:D-beta-D-heptose 7-phosphate kinase/D-beta-D-heptose 1-phosphate adenosyltransferase